MVDSAIEKLVLARDLGQPLGAVRLRGRVELPGGATALPWLVRTDRGAFLLATEDGYATVKGPAPEVPVTYTTEKKGGVLEIDGLRADVPSKLTSEVFELLGLARHPPGREPPLPLEPGPSVAPIRTVERAVVAETLAKSEVLLACVPSRTEEPMASWALSEGSGRALVFVTEERIVLLVVSPVGDVRTETVAGADVHAEEGGRRLVVGERTLDTRDQETRASRLGVLAPLSPDDRVLECARLLFREGRDARHLSHSRVLLQRAARRGDPRAEALALMVAAELGESQATFPDVDGDALDRHPGAATALADAYRTWGLSPAAGLALVEHLKTARSTLALHAVVRADLAPKQSKMEAALGDTALGEHAIAAGELERAQSVVSARLEQLPVSAIEQLEPRSAEVAARVAVRIRLLELLAVAKGTPGGSPDAGAVQELARAEPLAPERLRELVRIAAPTLSARAQAALDVLGNPPLSPPSATEPLDDPRPLTDEELRRIRGPAPHDLSTRLAGLQRVVAQPRKPDASAVVDFCEAIEPGRGPAGRALVEARTLLGLSDAQAYISRGRSHIGIRAFEGQPAFLLVGSRHLDDRDPAYLPLPSMRAAFASELAHVRFDHGRVTADQVWEGALAKSRQGLEFVLAAVPVLQSLRAVSGVSRVASRIDQKSLQRALDGAERLNEIIGRAMSATRTLSAAPDSLATSNEQLIEAHRYLQLTADRVGLVAAGDLRSAVFAMIAVRPRYVDALADAGDASLLDILRQGTEETDRAFTDLALRIAGAISFLLSDDFEAIRVELQS